VYYSDLYYQTLQNLPRYSRNKDSQSSLALDIQILMEKAFGLSRDQFWIMKQNQITDRCQLRKFYRYLERLKNHEPLAYIIQEKQFYTASFFVNKHVLIPRPETELIVEKAIDTLTSPARVLDIGAGSGNISIVIALETGSMVLAIEKDKKTFQVLCRNIGIHRVKGQVIPQHSDLFPKKKSTFDLIVSNPPYVSENEWIDLPPHIRNHEPKQALVSGPSGYEIIEKIISRAKEYLKPTGKLLIEIGYQQKPVVEKLLIDADFHHIDFINDYGQIPRIACAQP
jgi:release factor glutamine methyltransferase